MLLNRSGTTNAIILMIVAVLHTVDGCGVCSCHASRGFSSPLVPFSRNPYFYTFSVKFTANCTDRNLTNVPYSLLVIVTTVYLDHNNLTYLDKNIFSSRGLVKINTLYLNNNSINAIHEEAFHGLSDLKTLVLDGNKITTLPLNVFEPCNLLNYISLSGNNIILPDYIFQGKMDNLETAIVSHCNLTALPKDFSSMQLNHLDISNNALGDSFVINFSVQSLNISNNKIIDLTKEGTNFSSLNTLDLSGNTLIFKPDMNINSPNLKTLISSSCQLGDRFQHLLQDTTDLKVLDLSRNKINTVNSSVLKSFISLEELYLQDNNIKFLEPNCFGNNERLNKVNLSANPLDFSKYEMFLNSSSLKFLYASHCNISKITHISMQGTPSLQIIDFRYNYIEEIDDYFHNLADLERLFLDGNRIRTINPEAFVNNIHLVELTLAGNPILLPEAKPFLHSPSLTILNLNFCNITYVFSNIFKNTPYLTSLSLRNNSIRTVDVSAFQKLGKLDELDLMGNPLICDSRLKQVFKWCLTHGVEGHAFCEFPKGNWKILEHLHLEDNHEPLSDAVHGTNKPSEVQNSRQDFTPEYKPLSSAVMYVLLAVGTIIGTVVGVVLGIFVSRRHRFFMHRTVPFYETLFVKK